MYNLLKKVYSNKKLCGCLSAVAELSVVLTALSFVPLMWGAALISPISALKVAVITAVPLLFVTLLRSHVNAPRPYELYDFYEHRPKNKTGESFPSRHAYSSFVLATVSAFIYPLLGVILLVLGIIICTTRVLLGIHFLRDVAAGALIGIVSALFGVYILIPF